MIVCGKKCHVLKFKADLMVNLVTIQPPSKDKLLIVKSAISTETIEETLDIYM